MGAPKIKRRPKQLRDYYPAKDYTPTKAEDGSGTRKLIQDAHAALDKWVMKAPAKAAVFKKILGAETRATGRYQQRSRPFVLKNDEDGTDGYRGVRDVKRRPRIKDAKWNESQPNLEKIGDRAVNHAAHDARGILDWLAAAELNIVRTEKHQAAAEFANAHFERHTRARRRFFKDHRQGFPGERPITTAVLVSGGDLEDAPQLGAVELIDVE